MHEEHYVITDIIGVHLVYVYTFDYIIYKCNQQHVNKFHKFITKLLE